MIKLIEDAKSDKIDLDIQKSLDKIAKLKNTWNKWREKADKQKGILQKLFNEYNLNVSILEEYIDIMEYNAVHSWRDRKSTPSEFILIVREYDDIYDAYNKCDECAEYLRSNKEKIKDAEAYQAKLQDRKAQYAQKLDRINQLPQIIIDFLEDWKEESYDFYTNAYERYIEKLKEFELDRIRLKRQCIQEYDCYARYIEIYGDDINDDSVVRGITMYPNQPYRDLEKEQGLDYASENKKLRTMFSKIVFDMRQKRSGERDAYLKKCIEQECVDMKKSLIDQVTDCIGNITDASGLSVGAKGIEGYIVGDKIINGKNAVAHLHSTLAGGYNIQCLHYRFYVTLLK